MSISLSELNVGDRARILGFKSVTFNYQDRLLAMGLVPEAEFTLTQVAPLGDPVVLKIHHSSICLRKNEASILSLERLGSDG